jgi:L-lactate dehydrogenase complex protein LldF
MQSTAHAFAANARVALADRQLQTALAGLDGGLVARRAQARSNLPEFEALREVARDIKNHTLANLDAYLEAWEAKATAAGATVHFAATAADARDAILNICRSVDAKLVTKGKSMVSEEIGLNAHLEDAGLTVVETDLGEYLVQIRKETPSHIIAPAIHLTQDQVEEDFRRVHTHLPRDRNLVEAETLVGEARTVLREKYGRADVGITGANFLVAETGACARRDHIGREARADARGRVDHPEAAGALGDGARVLDLLHVLDRTAPRGGPGRAGAIPRRRAGQRAHRPARD